MTYTEYGITSVATSRLFLNLRQSILNASLIDRKQQETQCSAVSMAILDRTEPSETTFAMRTEWKRDSARTIDGESKRTSEMIERTKNVDLVIS